VPIITALVAPGAMPPDQFVPALKLPPPAAFQTVLVPVVVSSRCPLTTLVWKLAVVKSPELKISELTHLIHRVSA